MGQLQGVATQGIPASTIIPKLLIKAVCKSSTKKDACVKTFTLRNVDIDQVTTRDELKHVILTQLTDDIIIRGDFDVGYYQASTIVSIRSPQDVREIWSDVKRGVKHVLWCDGLKERNTVLSKTRKRSKKKDSESDSDEDVVETVTNKKKKQTRKDEKLEEIVTDLKEMHGQQYTPMQYRIWGEMIVGGLYSSKNECPSTSMFSRAGGKEPPKKKSDVAEALGEVAKHVSAAFSGAIPSTRSSSGNKASPAKSIDNRSKCYKQLGELNALRSAGVLTEEEYQSEKEAIMATLKKL